MLCVNTEPRWYVRFVSTICLIFLIGNFGNLRAQSNPCPQNGRAAWPQGSTTRYFINPNLPGTAVTQIRSAMSKWHAANQMNGSRVSFVEETNPFNWGETATLTFQVGENPTTLPDGTPGWAAATTHKELASDGKVLTATVTIDPTLKAGIDMTPGAPGLNTIFEKLGLHETGHTMGLDHPLQGTEEGGATVMNRGVQVNDSWNNQALNITPCDQNGVSAQPFYPQPTPAPTPDPNCTATELGEPGDYGCYHCYDSWDSDCDLDIDFGDADCGVCYPSPIVIDVLGNGFTLTDLEHGVVFDITGIGRPMRLAWIQGDDAWLVLDRNGNGTVDNGAELFGNFTPQTPSLQPNGFAALAEYDAIAQGGNHDGVVDIHDAIFASLRLWQDTNRNGVSEANSCQELWKFI